MRLQQINTQQSENELRAHESEHKKKKKEEKIFSPLQ